MTIPFYLAKENFKIIAPINLMAATEAAIKSIVPNASFGSGRQVRVTLTVLEGGRVCVCVALEGGQIWKASDVILEERCLKESVRLGIHRVFQAFYDLGPSPWGTLTGVRPTKLVHSLFDSGSSWEEIRGALLVNYALNPEKADLLITVTKGQRAFFHTFPNNPISIYIGIPFCPTRCSYCSFAAYPLTSHGHLMKGFLSALQLEIKAVGNFIRELNLEVESIYLGGGTPTTIRGVELRKLLDLIREELFTAHTKEYTIEAGRPETLSIDTLLALKEAEVDRISINPQTMHDHTLELIGRKHNVADILKAFDLARQVDIPIINMDLILGLPGENLGHVEYTLSEIGKLRPDNLTVHSLALKKGSKLKRNLGEFEVAHAEGEKMINLARNTALDLGMSPYYLYRQRHILGGLENVGYAREDLSSIYNVQMMEERQSIIAIGGGGITKLVSPDLSLVRHFNAKCPATYSQQIEESLAKKMEQISRHFE